jgi:hypothetical protein
MMNRQGFSLVEVIVMQNAVTRMVHQVAVDTRSTTALQLVEDRLALVRSDPQYDLLQTRYAATETNPGGNSGLTRVTAFTHVRDSTARGITDYERVTVSVSGTGLTRAVARTETVGAP